MYRYRSHYSPAGAPFPRKPDCSCTQYESGFTIGDLYTFGEKIGLWGEDEGAALSAQQCQQQLAARASYVSPWVAGGIGVAAFLLGRYLMRPGGS